MNFPNGSCHSSQQQTKTVVCVFTASTPLVTRCFAREDVQFTNSLDIIAHHATRLELSPALFSVVRI